MGSSAMLGCGLVATRLKWMRYIHLALDLMREDGPVMGIMNSVWRSQILILTPMSSLCIFIGSRRTMNGLRTSERATTVRISRHMGQNCHDLQDSHKRIRWDFGAPERNQQSGTILARDLNCAFLRAGVGFVSLAPVWFLDLLFKETKWAVIGSTSGSIPSLGESQGNPNRPLKPRS